VPSNRVYEGVGNETTLRMATKAVEWISVVLTGDVCISEVKEGRI